MKKSLKPFLFILSITVLSKITGLTRELLITRKFGFTAFLDQFYLSTSPTSIFISFLAPYTINQYILPGFIRIRQKHGPSKAVNYLKTQFLYFELISLVFILFFFILTFFSPGQVTSLMFQYSFFCPGFILVSFILTYYQLIRKETQVPFYSVAENIFFILLLLVFASLINSPSGLISLRLFSIYAIAFLLLANNWSRISFIHFKPYHSLSCSLFFLFFTALGLESLNAQLDKFLAYNFIAEPGIVTALEISTRLIRVPLFLVSVAISLLFTVNFSEKSASGKNVDLLRSFLRQSVGSFFITGLSILLFALMGKEMLMLLFYQGMVKSTDISVLFNLSLIFMFSLFGYIPFILFKTYLFAAQRYSVVSVILINTILLHAVFFFLLSKMYGIFSLAYSHTISIILTGFICLMIGAFEFHVQRKKFQNTGD